MSGGRTSEVSMSWTDVDVGLALAAVYLVALAVASLGGHGGRMLEAMARREP